jgi:beta-glucanase (GH16 family)
MKIAPREKGGRALRVVIKALAVVGAIGFAAVAFSDKAQCAPCTDRRLDRSGLQLTFDDEFDALSWDDPRTPRNEGRWRTWYRNGDDPYALDNRTLPHNQEMQVYGDTVFPGRARGVAPPVTVDHGVLHLTAVEAPAGVRSALWGRRYISGMVSNWGSFSQLYGVFEIQARLPAGRGLWPAFWLLPSDGSWPPEIDVFEFLGHEATTLHVGYRTRTPQDPEAGDGAAVQGAGLTTGFHTYSVEWTPETIVYYLDDLEIARWPTPKDMHKPMFIILNLAVGGTWPGAPDAGTPFPATFEIDWVRAYQR